jgi:dimethylamine---corrinoid protein Co-methyltransferase
VEHTVPTRMGDGSMIYMSRSDIESEVRAGVEAAVKRAKTPSLAEDEVAHLVDIYASPSRFTGVDIGTEVVLSYDGSGIGTFTSGLQDLQMYEQCFAADLVEQCHGDYSFKAVKTIVPYEAQRMRDAQLALTVPVQYGAMPNLGLYCRPDGPAPNWAELLPLGRFDEARAGQEEAVEFAVADMVNVGEALAAAGADGIDFDTAGAAGDADFLATLRAAEALRARYPEFGIEIGMAGEFVLGMHGELEYDGMRLAGLWPREQLRVATKAGAHMFGPAVNVNTGKSAAWNVARAVTLVKPCMEEATIPIHMNVGMGVGGVPMTSYNPVDAVSRASRACVDILRLDGL